MLFLTYLHGKGVKNAIEVKITVFLTKIDDFRAKTDMPVPAEPEMIES